MNSLISIYIPRMSLYITEDIIKEEFSKFIGNVSRVDFTCLDKKPGFNENFNNLFKSAFIHFTYYYTNNYTESILLTLNNENSYKYYPKCKNEYWILLKAKNPILETWMNNSQIVENCRFLQNKIELQEETIESLKEKLEMLTEKMKILEGNNKFKEEIFDNALLQRKQKIYLDKKNSCNFSIITHSSMPSLLSNNSSISDIDEINYNIEFEKRKSNSVNLCGNE